MSRNEALKILCHWASETHPGNEDFNAESIIDGNVVAQLLYRLCSDVFTMEFVEEVEQCDLDEFGSTSNRLRLIQTQMSAYFMAVYKKDPTSRPAFFPRIFDLCNKNDESAQLTFMYLIAFISSSMNNILSQNLRALLEKQGRTIQRRFRRMEANLDDFLCGEAEPEEDVCTLKERNDDLNTQLSTIMNDLTKHRNNEILLNDDLKRTQAQLNNLIEEKEKSKERRSLDDKFLAECVNEKDGIIRTLEENIQKLEELLDEKEQELTVLDVELCSLQSLYERDTKSYEENREQAEREIEQLKKDAEKARTGSPDYQAMTELRARNENLMERNAMLEMKVKLLEDQREEFEGIQKSLAEKTRLSEDLQARLGDVNVQNQSLKEENEKLNEKKEELERSEADLTNTLNDTREKMEKEINDMKGSLESCRLQNSVINTIGKEEDTVTKRQRTPIRSMDNDYIKPLNSKFLAKVSNVMAQILIWILTILFLVSSFAAARYGWCSYYNQPFTLFGEVKLNGNICRLYPDVCLFTQLMKRPLDEF